MAGLIIAFVVVMFIGSLYLIITKKEVFKNTPHIVDDYTITTLGPNDCEEIQHVMATAKSTIDDSLYVCATVEELQDMFARGGAAFGIKVDDKLVATLTVDVPNDVYGVAYEDYLAEANTGNTRYMENCAVIPEYRGNSFQRVLVKYAENWLTSFDCDYYMCTVAPGNVASHHSMEMIGYTVIATDYLYGGNLRDIMCKEAPKNRW